jgi:hypothetical protein
MQGCNPSAAPEAGAGKGVETCPSASLKTTYAKSPLEACRALLEC